MTACCSLRPLPAPQAPFQPRTARCGSAMRAWASRSELSPWSRMSRVSDRHYPLRFRDRDVRLLLCSLPGARRWRGRPAESQARALTIPEPFLLLADEVIE